MSRSQKGKSNLKKTTQMISKIIYRSGDGGVGWVVGSGKRDLTPGTFELHILPTPSKWNTNYVK